MIAALFKRRRNAPMSRRPVARLGLEVLEDRLALSAVPAPSISLAPPPLLSGSTGLLQPAGQAQPQEDALFHALLTLGGGRREQQMPLFSSSGGAHHGSTVELHATPSTESTGNEDPDAADFPDELWSLGHPLVPIQGEELVQVAEAIAAGEGQ
jgi:hypothetical protein